MTTHTFLKANIFLFLLILLLNASCEQNDLPGPNLAIEAAAAEGQLDPLREEKGNSHNSKNLTVGMRAWVWAGSPSSTFYYPYSTYQYTSTSSSQISISKTGTGKYTVTIPRAGAHFQGVAHASAYGGNHTAQIASWYAVGADLKIKVITFTTNGLAQNGKFELFFYRETRSAINNSAYQWVNSPTNLNTTYAYNSKGLLNQVEKLGIGIYRITFSGITKNPFGPGKSGNIMATPYGNSSRRISVVNWAHSSNSVKATVRLTNANGNPVDGKFVISYISDFGLGQGDFSESHDYGAYAWANLASVSSSYSPDNNYSILNNYRSIQIQRLNTGYYRVNLPYIRNYNSTMAIVTPYGSFSNYASISHWTSNGQGGTYVYVRCYTPSGTPIDNQFNLFYYTNENVLF